MLRYDISSTEPGRSEHDDHAPCYRRSPDVHQLPLILLTYFRSRYLFFGM